MSRDKNSASHQFGQLRRSLKRYREGIIDAEVLAKAVEQFLQWDENYS